MKLFSGLVAALVACGATLFLIGEEWQAFIASAPNTVIPIGIPSYTQGDPITVGATPFAVAVSPDGTMALVTDYTSNDITVLDLTTSPVSTYTVMIDNADATFEVAITPDGKKALVDCALTAGGYGVAVLDLTTSPITMEPSIVQVASAAVISITPDGTRALVAPLALAVGTSMTVLDLTTTPISIATNLVLGSYEGGIAITPDGTKALAISSLLNGVTVLDLTTPVTPTQLYTIPVGRAPFDVAITPDGKRALVTCTGGGAMSAPSGITVLDLTTTPFSVLTDLVPLTAPFFVAITPDGKTGVVTTQTAVLFDAQRKPANGGGSVVVYDLTTTPISVITTLSFETSLLGLAITPDQAPTARFRMRRDGKKIVFNAGSSTSSVGSIAKYHWKFGDGHRKTTTSPVVAHRYHSLYHDHSKKTRTATLTVTNTAGTSTKVTFTGRTVSNHGGSSAIRKHHLITHSRGCFPRVVAKKKIPSPRDLLMAVQ